jgi:hypothetical protein
MSSLCRFVILLGTASTFLLGCSAVAIALAQDHASSATDLVPLLTVQVGAAPVATLGLVQSDLRGHSDILPALTWLGHATAAATLIGTVMMTIFVRQRIQIEAVTYAPSADEALRLTEVVPVALPASGPRPNSTTVCTASVPYEGGPPMTFASQPFLS